MVNPEAPEQTPKRIGIFTGGGLAPGLNSVVANATLVLKDHGIEVVGIPDGWEGLLEVRRDIVILSNMSRRQLMDLALEAGSRLGSSRPEIKTILKDKEKYVDIIKGVAEEYGLTGLIPVGGDDTLGLARDLGIPCVGVPKTIDRDIAETESTFGFETAYHQASERIRQLRKEAKGLSRVAIAEVMGRDAGWITLYAGKAGGADISLLREFPIPEDKLMQIIAERYNELNADGEPERNVVIALAEGYEHEGTVSEDETVIDGAGHAKKEGALKTLKKAMDKRLVVVGSGPNSRAKVVPDAEAYLEENPQEGALKQVRPMKVTPEIIGYDVRKRRPIGYDRIFAGELGGFAGYLAANGQFGVMVALKNGKLSTVPLTQVKGGRIVDERYYDTETLSMRNVPIWNIDQAVLATRGDLGRILDH